MAPRPRTRPDIRAVRPHLKGWLSLNGEFLVGPRYIKLLEGIDRTGTIREGCIATRMSYRTCLSRLRQMEQVLGAPIVITRRGGSDGGHAELTDLARGLIAVYREWREEVEASSQALFRDLLRTRARKHT
jgi:molybdate transport system regulatory protein